MRMSGQLSGMRVAVLAERQYEELELWYPLLRLREEGAAAVVVGPRVGEYASKRGYPVQAECAAHGCQPGDFAGVIVPGGNCPDYLRRDDAVVALVREVASRGGVVGAICHGGSVLCSADILRGRRVTSHPAIAVDLRNAGGRWEDAEVVVDGPLVTSRHPDDLPAFWRAFAEALLARA